MKKNVAEIWQYFVNIIVIYCSWFGSEFRKIS